MSLFNLCNERLQQSGTNNNTFTKRSEHGWHNSAYGKQWMDSNSKAVYSWNVKINKMTNYIAFGFVSNLHHQDTNKHFDAKHSYWCYLCDGQLRIDNQTHKVNGKHPGHESKTGDVLTFIIDFNRMEFQCLKNGNKSNKKILCKIKGQNIKYRLALSIHNIGESITIISNNDINDDEKSNDAIVGAAFSQKIRNLEADNDTKTAKIMKDAQTIEELRDQTLIQQGIIASLQNDKKSLTDTNSGLKNDNKEKTSENERLKKENTSLKDTVSKKTSGNEGLKRENESLQNDKVSLAQTIVGLKSDNKEKISEVEGLKQENGSLKGRVSSLEDERKEFEMTINELKEENKRLKLENINTDNYENWSVEEIVYWIISLDVDVFGEYEEVLMQTLKEENVNGKCLLYVDIADIKRWGIKSFMQSKRLLKEITLLLQNKGKKKSDSMLNEGANPPTAYI